MSDDPNNLFRVVANPLVPKGTVAFVCIEPFRPGDVKWECKNGVSTFTMPAPKFQVLGVITGIGEPRLCPGCRSLDGEHDFGLACTLREDLADPSESE